MEFFTDPKVYLIAYPKLNWSTTDKSIHGIYNFFEDMDNYGKKSPVFTWQQSESGTRDADLLPEFCGRMCYCSFGDKQGRKNNKDYLKNIIDMGHGSVLEHANFTFLVTQCSRGFTHEMVRHRAGFAYSQESTHYIDYNIEKGRIVLDTRACEVTSLKDLMEETAENIFGIYNLLYESFKRKHKKKDACSMARQMLPIGIEAKLAFTGNVRALRHFMVMRGNAHNVLEIRKIAVAVYKILIKLAPNSLYGLTLITSSDGFESINTSVGAKV